MRRSLLILTLAALGVAGCDRGQAPVAQAPDAASDLRPLMPQIAALDVEPTPSGAIVRATGLPPVQGYWNGALVPVDTADPSVLGFQFRAEPPEEAARISTARSRHVTVAVFVPEARLRGIREIRVAAAGNVRAARR